MHARGILGLPVFALLLGLAGCLAPETGMVEYTAGDNGRTVRLAAGTHFKVRLASNITTGFAWQLSALNEAIVAQVSHRYIEPAVVRPGAGGTEEWEFAAQAAGTTTLQMAYRRPWEKDVPPAETFELTIQAVASDP